MEVHITTEGNVDDCKIVTDLELRAAGPGRLRLCQARLALAAAHPAGYARHDVSTRVSVKWDLKDAK